MISICLSIFADGQLKVVYGLFFKLASRYRDDIFGSSGFYNLHLQSVCLAALWAFVAVYWISKMSKSPASDAASALLGAAFGGIFGFWLHSPGL
jgi:hypothetical protein